MLVRVTQYVSPAGKFSQAGRESEVQQFDDSTSLKKLVAAVCMGNEAAYSEFHRRFKDVVCRIAFVCLWKKGCDQLADHSEDIISSSWLAILEHLHQLKEMEKIEGWMGTIVLHVVCGHVSGPKGCISQQQKRVQWEAAERARIQDANKVCQNALLAGEIKARAYEISTTFAEVLLLFVVEEFTMDEIARDRGESPSKLRSMYYRYLRALKKSFRDDGNDDNDPSEL